MNWDAIAAIAELLASAGVIVSLVYLATQIRHQVAESLLSASHELASQLNHAWSGVTDNADFAALYLKGIKNYNTLDGVEKIRVSAFFGRIMRIFESMYSRHKHAKIDPTIWPGIEAAMRDFGRYAGFREWWAGNRHWFSADCQALVSNWSRDRRA